MLIRLVSDLHLAHGTEYEHLVPPMEEDEETVLVLAGDVCVGFDVFDTFLRTMSERFYKVLYVLGNHEFYGQNITLFADALRDRLGQANFENVILLDNDKADIQGVRFIGSTLWTDCRKADPIHVMRVQQGLNDYEYIRKAGKRFTVQDMMKLHKEAVDYLQSALSEDFDGQRVVITHHLPSYASVHPKFRTKPGSFLNAGFYSDLDELLAAYDIKYWLHGHTHETHNSEVEGVAIYMNPAGYPFRRKIENSCFLPCFRLEI